MQIEKVMVTEAVAVTFLYAGDISGVLRGTGDCVIKKFFYKMFLYYERKRRSELII